MTRREWLYVGTVVIAVAQCMLWLFLAIGSWFMRAWVIPPSSAEVADNTRFALALLVVLSLSVIAVVAFLLRPLGWGGIVLAAVEAGSVVFSVFAAVSRADPVWLLIVGSSAATAVVLVFLLRRTGALRSSTTS